LTVYLAKWGVAQTPWVGAANREPSYLFVYAPTSFHWRDLLLQGAKSEDSGQAVHQVVQDGQIDPGRYAEYIKALNWWNKAAAVMVAFWLWLIFLLILGFGY